MIEEQLTQPLETVSYIDNNILIETSYCYQDNINNVTN